MNALLPSPIGPLYVEADEHGLTKLYTDGHRLHADAGPDDGTFAEVAQAARRVLRRRARPSSTSRSPSTARRSSSPSGPRCARSRTARRPPTASSRASSAASPRAVGRANGRNQISIIVPCHRVIGADGSLTGYAGGLEAKRTLLDHEQGVGSLDGVPQPR